MAMQTYIMKDGIEKAFNISRFKSLIQKKQEPHGAEGRRTQNSVMYELAEYANVSFSTIKHWFNGHNAPGDPEIISKTAEYFGVDADELFTEPNNTPMMQEYRERVKADSLKAKFKELISPFRFVGGNIDLHECVEFQKKPANSIVISKLQNYFAGVVMSVLEYQVGGKEGKEPIDLSVSIEINGTTSINTQEPVEFIEFVLYELPNASRFKIELHYCGREFRWDESDSSRFNNLCDFFAADEMRNEKFCFKQSEFLYNCNEYSAYKIVDGNPIDIDAECTYDIVHNSFDKDWYSWNLNLYAEFDFEKHNDILTSLQAAVKKHIPQDEFKYCLSDWKDGETQALVSNIQWCVPELSIVQNFLNEINEILSPIKDDCKCFAEGIWFIPGSFTAARWRWSDNGFEVVGTEF